jgi:hypothetical protein
MSCRRIVVLREVSSSARGDDDRHARREEQRASGLAKVVKSNLGKPGLSKHRVVHLTDEIGFGVGAEYPFQPEEPSRPPLRLPSCYALMENALGCLGDLVRILYFNVASRAVRIRAVVAPAWFLPVIENKIINPDTPNRWERWSAAQKSREISPFS